MANRNKREQSKWQLPLQLIAVILLSALLVGILFAEITRSADALQYEEAQLSSVPLSMEKIGYLFYDTTVVEHYDMGPIDYRIPDRTSVQAGDTLAVVYADTEGKGARERAREIITEIECLQALDNVTTPPDYHGAYASLMATLSAGGMQATADDVATLTDALALFAAQAEEASVRAAKIAALRAEFDELIRNAIDANSTVTAPATGLFYRTVDGFETNMTAAAAETLTVGALAALLASPQDTAAAIGAVITSGSWHLAVTVTAAEAGMLTVGSAYTVNFAVSGTARALVLSRIAAPDADGNCLLVLSGDGMPPADLARRQQISLCYGKREGILVPMSALTEQDGAIGVYVFEDGRAAWRTVTLAYAENGYCLAVPDAGAGALAQGERVLVTLRRVYEGKLL